MGRFLMLLQAADGTVRADLRRHHTYDGSKTEALLTVARPGPDGLWRFRVPSDITRVVRVEIAGWEPIDLDRHRATAHTTTDEWTVPGDCRVCAGIGVVWLDDTDEPIPCPTCGDVGSA